VISAIEEVEVFMVLSYICADREHRILVHVWLINALHATIVFANCEQWPIP